MTKPYIRIFPETKIKKNQPFIGHKEMPKDKWILAVMIDTYGTWYSPLYRQIILMFYALVNYSDNWYINWELEIPYIEKLLNNLAECDKHNLKLLRRTLIKPDPPFDDMFSIIVENINKQPKPPNSHLFYGFRETKENSLTKKKLEKCYLWQQLKKALKRVGVRQSILDLEIERIE